MDNKLIAYQYHIDSWAKELGCRLDIDPKFRTTAMMFVEEQPPRVEVAPITDQISYLISLHELSHVQNGDTQGRPPFEHKQAYFTKGVLFCEADAWNLALDKCIDPIEDASRHFMWSDCLGTYYQFGYLAARGAISTLPNGNRHYVKFTWDHPGEYFEGVMKRIQGNLTDYKIQYKGRWDK